MAQSQHRSRRSFTRSPNDRDLPPSEWPKTYLVWPAENARLSAGKLPHVLQFLKDPRVLQISAISCLTIGGSMGFALIAPQVLMSGTGLDIHHVGYLISVGGLMTDASRETYILMFITLPVCI